MPVNFDDELRLSYLKAAMSAQQEIEDKIQVCRAFYEGEHGAYTTSRQDEYLFEDVDSFGNICKRVVNVPKDRLQVDKIMPADQDNQAYADIVTQWWYDNRLESKQKEMYEAALRDGAVALVVDWDIKNNRPTFIPNLIYDGGTGLVRFHYDADDNLLFASKRWTVWNPLKRDETGKRRLTIYRPDLIERYEADNHQPTGWRFLSPQELNGPNPQIWTDTGTASGDPIGIPVIPFENPSGPELTPDIITIQEIMSHNISTADIVVDFHAWPVIAVSGVILPVDSSTGKSELPSFGPGTGLTLEVGGQLTRLDPVDVQKVFQGVWSWVELIALLKGWPFFMFNTSADMPSGVALQIAEGSLVKQVVDKQKVFGGAWADAFNIARKLAKLNDKKEYAGELKFEWASPMTNDALAQAEAQAKQFEAGQYPTISRWRLMGHTQAEIDQFLEDAAREDSYGLIEPTSTRQ